MPQFYLRIPLPMQCYFFGEKKSYIKYLYKHTFPYRFFPLISYNILLLLLYLFFLIFLRNNTY